MAIEIGSIVTHIMYGDTKYEVLGDRNNPYDGRGSSPYHQPISVSEGNDFLLGVVEIPEGQTNSAFVHAREQDLTAVQS